MYLVFINDLVEETQMNTNDSGIFNIPSSNRTLADRLVQANMNSDIPLQTAAIYFLTNISETGCWLGVCHG